MTSMIMRIDMLMDEEERCLVPWCAQLSNVELTEQLITVRNPYVTLNSNIFHTEMVLEVASHQLFKSAIFIFQDRER